ncbi:chitin deacetylase 8-like [Gigantopelta aegis]|uniref:chitin deacetylase 8-like n=1 Tax=Gigantopelta aegis TaxID=1735272 RepID=UPI001B887A0F|nr:chitin deacetylase 8-like [Gigantopelta aegis]
MMVMLTFDDSVNVGNFDFFRKLFDGKFRNPNGCGIKGTFFVSGDATQYHLVEELYKMGMEISSHSLSHRSPTTWWAKAGYDGYVHEIEGMRKRLSRQGKIPHDDIKGMRVPFLQVGGDDQYQMLADYDYLYDSSMVTGHLYKNDKPPVWPFTLDWAPDSKTCSLAPCPQKSYPGLWEIPLIRWYGSNKMACAMPDGCVIGLGRQGTLDYLNDNFNRHYSTNRSPLGIFLHASWFRRKAGNFEGMMDFLQELSRMDDVWVISASQVLDWIKKPVPISQVKNIDSWQC